ncbi:MAG: hypothetical protein U0514_00540 [Candidatus Andersenbacteria bacterium]
MSSTSRRYFSFLITSLLGSSATVCLMFILEAFMHLESGLALAYIAFVLLLATAAWASIRASEWWCNQCTELTGDGLLLARLSAGTVLVATAGLGLSLVGVLTFRWFAGHTTATTESILTAVLSSGMLSATAGMILVDAHALLRNKQRPLNAAFLTRAGRALY